MKAEDITNKMMPGFIKRKRKEMKISQAEMAKLLGLSREMYNKWENSLMSNSSERLLQICRILKMPNLSEVLPSFNGATDRDIKLYLRGYTEGVSDYQNIFGSEYYLYDYIEKMHQDNAALEISIIQNLIQSGTSIRVIDKDRKNYPEYYHTADWQQEDFEVELKVRNEKYTHYLSFQYFDAKLFEYTQQCSRFAEYTAKDLTASLRKIDK